MGVVDHRSVRREVRASRLVEESWAFLRRHWSDFLRAGSLPLALMLLSGTASVVATRAGVYPVLVDIVSTLLYVVIGSLFGVAWHRLILSDVRPPWIASWSGAHTRFAAFLLVFGLGFSVASLALVAEASGSTVLLALLFLIAIVVVQVRLSLFLPSSAISQVRPLSDCWSLSRGYGWSLFWAGALSGLLALALGLPLVIGALWLDRQGTTIAQLGGVPLNSGVGLLAEALAVGSLSFAHRAMVSEEEGTELQ